MGERTRVGTEPLTKTHNDVRVLRLLTTRGNATGLLSGGVIFPWGDAMPAWTRGGKLHRDPGGLIHEYLLLFAEAPGEAVIRELMDTGEDQFPVILEINPRYLAQPNFVIDHEYNVVPARDGLGVPLALLMHGLIPTVAIERVVFRSKGELGEFRARPMDNFDPASVSFEMRVNPGEFLDTTIDVYRLREALWNVPDVELPPVPATNAAALGGAAILVGSVAERRSDFPIQRLGGLFDVLRGVTSESSAQAGVLNNLPDLLLPIPNRAGKTANMAETNQGEDAFLLFLIELVDLQPRDFVPIKVLNQVGQRLKQDGSPNAQTLTLFADVLDGFASIDQVPEDTPDLLLAIFDVCRAGGLPDQSSTGNAPPLTLDREIGAAILAGVLLGRDRIPLTSRPTSKQLLDRLDGAVARRANEAAGSKALLVEGPRVSVETVTLDQKRVERLLAGSHILMERRTSLDSPAESAHAEEKASAENLEPPDSETEMVDAASTRAEPELLPTAGATLATLCERAGWRDLIALEFPEPLRLQMEMSRGHETGWIRLQGVTLSQAAVIVDREKVLQRLAFESASLDEHLRADLARVIGEGVPEHGMHTSPPTNEDKAGTPWLAAPAIPAAEESLAGATSELPTRTRKNSDRKPKDAPSSVPEESEQEIIAGVKPKAKPKSPGGGGRKKTAAPSAETGNNLPLLEAVEQARES